MSGSNADSRIKGWVDANVTYLEMLEPPVRPSVAPHPGVEMRRAINPTVSFYRYLYDTVGGDWNWTGRRLMDDATLAGLVQDPKVEVNVLWMGCVPAGLMELDRSAPSEIELLYFGLIPEYIGKGLGRFSLDWVIDHAWSCQPSRLWVHTCDLDHPNALPVYQKAGFVIYHHETSLDPVLHGMARPRRNGVDIPAEDIIPA